VYKINPIIQLFIQQVLIDGIHMLDTGRYKIYNKQASMVPPVIGFAVSL
jgi:hypothetical protein